MPKRVVTDEAEAMRLLGHEDAESPDGTPVTTGNDQVEPEKAEVTTEVEEPQEEVSETPQEQITEEQRRTWQSEADRAKAETERLRLEKAQYEAMVKTLMAQNQQLSGVVKPLIDKYGAPQEEKTPEPNFIEDGFYDPNKFATWMEKRDSLRDKKLVGEALAAFKKEQENMRVQTELTTVAKEFPEYVNPLTGQVDVQKLTSDVQTYTSGKGLIDIIKEMKGIKSAPMDKAMSAIEKNANKPSSVVSSQETDVAPKKTPSEIKRLMEVFGTVEIPDDFEM